jgi:hypothetical protein
MMMVTDFWKITQLGYNNYFYNAAYKHSCRMKHKLKKVKLSRIQYHDLCV